MVGAPFSLSALCLSRALQPLARLPSSSFEPSRVSASLRPNHKTNQTTIIIFLNSHLYLLLYEIKTNGGPTMTTILPWLTNTEDVIGTADELGKDCKKLDKLYDH